MVADILVRLGGISDHKTLVDASSRRALAKALESGAVVRVSHGLYAVPAADTARLAARRMRGVVSHLSAALELGLKVKFPPSRPAVTVARNRHPSAGDDVDLHYADLPPCDIASGVTTVIRTVVDCARTLLFDEALAVADSALRSGKVTRTALLAAVDAAPRNGRAAARRVMRHASAQAANPFESVLRAIALEVPGLCVVPQGAVGSVGHADLADTALQIAIEAESYEFHAQAEAFRHDVRRYTAMTRLDWVVVRFVWEDVMHRPSYVREVLADLVALRTGRLAAQRRTHVEEARCRE